MLEIPLSKFGKRRGQYSSQISEDEEELLAFNWMVHIGKNGDIYARRSINGGGINQSTEFLHRVILARMLVRPLLKTEDVDHIDGNGLNNQRSNLRLASRSQNKANSKVTTRNLVGSKGVRKIHENKYRAAICFHYKQIHIGYFKTEDEAAQAYFKKALELFGEYANDGGNREAKEKATK